jgi:hypothetical protein
MMLRLASVQRHADGEGDPGRPRLGGQRLLDREGGGHCVRRPGEGGHGAVALALLDGPHPGVGGDGGVDQLVVAGHGPGHIRRARLPAAGGALDVGQQERDRAGRERGGVVARGGIPRRLSRAGPEAG